MRTLPARHRGAAILVAMLIVALAAAAAAAALREQDLAIRQLTTMRDYEQAVWVLKGGAQWARSIMQQDARSSSADHAGERIAVRHRQRRVSQFRGLLHQLIRMGRPLQK